MRIGQLAKQANINIETVRFYERKGLIKQPLKPQQGYRDYPQKTLQRILFIKRAQKLGFTLEEISSLLSMESAHCLEIQELAANKLADVRSKINSLSQMEQVLEQLVKRCQSNQNHRECPIIETLLQD